MAVNVYSVVICWHTCAGGVPWNFLCWLRGAVDGTESKQVYHLWWPTRWADGIGLTLQGSFFLNLFIRICTFWITRHWALVELVEECGVGFPLAKIPGELVGEGGECVLMTFWLTRKRKPWLMESNLSRRWRRPRTFRMQWCDFQKFPSSLECTT